MFLLSALVTTTFDFFPFLTLPYYLFSGEFLGFSAHSKEWGRPLLWREVPLSLSSDRIPLLFTTPINPWMPPTLLLLPLLLPKKRKSTGPGEVSPYFFPYWALRIRCLYREVEILFDLCSSSPKHVFGGKEAFFFLLENGFLCSSKNRGEGISKKNSPNLREHL